MELDKYNKESFICLISCMIGKDLCDDLGSITGLSFSFELLNKSEWPNILIPAQQKGQTKKVTKSLP